MSTVYGEDVLGGQFVNTARTAVIDSFQGLLYSNPDVGLLDFGKVVVRRDYAANDIVKVISGGASGHEPAHAGFVGKGMLSAAVQGDVFCSPTMTDVLKTIKEVSYKQNAGVLIIVQNNAPDRLNFGLAAERAHGQHIQIKVIVVSEDCIAMNPQHGRRGIGGIILLNKIAGAMAEQKFVLEDIYQFCQQAHGDMCSILLSLHSCTSLTMDTCICVKQMAGKEMEIGTGLHGEPGLIRMKRATVIDACRVLIEEMCKTFALDASVPVVVLINNLGSSLQIEELIFVKVFASCLQEQGLTVVRVYHGQFLTALDMKGFSATVLKVSNLKILEYLDAPCEAFAWGFKNIKDIPTDAKEHIKSRLRERKITISAGPALSDQLANIIVLSIQFACDALVSCEKQINIIDSESGSGNMGSKIKCCAEIILLEARRKVLDINHPRLLFKRLSIIAEKSICGVLGSFYSIMFEAAANSFQELPDKDDINVYTWLKCLMCVNKAVKRYGKTEFGLGTMYDPLYACAETTEKALREGIRALEAFGLGVSASEEAALRSRHPLKKSPDPGAHIVGIWMRAVLEGIKMRCE